MYFYIIWAWFAGSTAVPQYFGGIAVPQYYPQTRPIYIEKYITLIILYIWAWFAGTIAVPQYFGSIAVPGSGCATSFIMRYQVLGVQPGSGCATRFRVCN